MWVVHEFHCHFDSFHFQPANWDVSRRPPKDDSPY